MNLIDSNNEPQTKGKGLKISLIIITILIILLLIAGALVWAYSQKIAKEQFKVYIDGEYSQKATSENGLFIIQNNKVYTSIKGIASYIGYTVYNGEYRQYTEDLTKCYATNQKELVTFSSGSSKIRKYPLLDKSSESQSFDIGEEIITKGSNLYINEEGLKRAFNMLITYSSNANTLTIATLPYLSTYYAKQITSASITDTENTNANTFNNQKALLYNLIVVKDSTSKLYGVASLTEPDNLIISARYTNIEFIEGINDFIVKTSENKVGIIGNDGITKVKPSYDDIQEIDKDIGLYLVTSNNKQGVINQNGKIIIYQDYDQIGLNSENTDNNVTNRYLLYNNCIPVMSNKKWGLIDKNGNKILPMEYDGIGCKINNSNTNNTNGIVLIPELEGIVLEKDEINANSTVKKYGIVSSVGTPMVNFVLDSAYATTVENTTTYYVTVQNQVIDIVNYWYEQKDKNSQENENNSIKSNVVDTNNTSNINSTTSTNNIKNETTKPIL